MRPEGCLPAPCAPYMRRYVKYVGSFVLLIPPSANACHIVSKWISISHFHLTRQQCVCLPPPVLAFSLHPLIPNATARGSRSRRDWKRDAEKMSAYASTLCVCLMPPQASFASAASPLCWSTLPAPLGTLENVTKILYWCLLLFVVVGALFLYFISFFLPFWWCC